MAATNHPSTETSAKTTEAPVKTTNRAPHRSLRWRGIDFLAAAMMAVAFGIAFWGFDTIVYPAVSIITAGFPPVGELTIGLWLLPAVIGGLVIRKPGAALLTELVAANVEVLLGNQWGIGVLVSALLQGLGVEIVLAVIRWRRSTLPVAVSGAVLSAALAITCYEWWVYVAGYSMVWKLIYLLCGLLSAAVIGGLGGWVLVRALKKTGVLKPFVTIHDVLS